MIHLPEGLLGTSALLALVGALPLERPEVDTIWAADCSLLEAVAVLRDFHAGRNADVLGDLTFLGIAVRQWVPTSVVAGALSELAIAHPQEIVSDLAGVAASQQLDLPLVTGQPHLADLGSGIATVVLRRLRR